jgi:exopolysaccharide biosynthesis polyprenyl glycosylphosphotransferase
MLLKLIIDVILINVSFILAYFFRFRVLLFITPDSIPIFEQYLNVLVFVTIIWLAIFKLVGLYEEKKFTTLLDEIASLFFGATLSSLVLLGLLFLYREFWFSRLVIANAWWIALLFLGLVRVIFFESQRIARLKGIGLRNTLILGAGEMGQVLALKIIGDRSLGYRMIGFLDDDLVKLGKSYHGIPVLGEVSKVKKIIEEKKIGEIIIASTEISAEKILDIITECEKYGVEFKIVPGILELIASRVDVDELGGVPLLTVTEIQLKGFNAAVKRSADVILSSILILLLSPLFIVFSVLIKLTSHGPVFFVQERIGLDGNIFHMFKFRSMIKDAEKLFPQLEPLSEVNGYLFKMKEDPRITPLGKFMRRFSIDELPQIFNVFFGQMSLVGPRPPLPREVEKYSAWHKKRLRVRPGITGPWQVSGRSLLPFEDMVRLDIYYIENWSLWLDFKILLRTIPVVLFGSGAY